MRWNLLHSDWSRWHRTIQIVEKNVTIQNDGYWNPQHGEWFEFYKLISILQNVVYSISDSVERSKFYRRIHIEIMIV